MDEQKKILPMTRVQKSKLTRQKIIDSTLELLQKYGYEQLTVRNICAYCDISNGSFYHYFSSKDDLMTEYLQQTQSECDGKIEEIGLLDYIIQAYLRQADQFISMGVEFTSHFYTPTNQAFNTSTRRHSNYVSSLYEDELATAKTTGFIRAGIHVPTIVHTIQVIVIGNTFSWCAHNGNRNLKYDLEHGLRFYLNAVFSDDYFAIYPKVGI